MGWLVQDYMSALLLEAALDKRRGLGFFVFWCEGPPPGPIQVVRLSAVCAWLGLLYDSAF